MADVYVLVEVWLPPRWTSYTSGRLDDVRWELDELSAADLAALTTLAPGAQHQATNGDMALRITRVDGWEIHCTAWDLLGQWSFALDTTHEVCLPRGHAAYHWAAASQDNRKVRLTRLLPLADMRLRVVSRYVGAKDPVVLRPIVR